MLIDETFIFGKVEFILKKSWKQVIIMSKTVKKKKLNVNSILFCCYCFYTRHNLYSNAIKINNLSWIVNFF